MENQIYRVDMTDNYKLEFYVCDTNELNPHRHIKELGVVAYNKEQLQLDASLDEAELQSLIDYLTNVKKHISEFNKNSKPTEEPC